MGSTFPPSLLLESLAVDPLLSPAAIMANIANDKGSFSDSNGLERRSGGQGPLSGHTYVQNPVSPLRVIGNPGPL